MEWVFLRGRGKGHDYQQSSEDAANFLSERWVLSRGLVIECRWINVVGPTKNEINFNKL